MTIDPKVCTRCGATYEPSGLCQKYCSSCRMFVLEEQRITRYLRRKAKLKEQKKGDA